MSRAKICLFLALSLFIGCSGSALAAGGQAASSMVGDAVYSLSEDASVLELSQSALVGDYGVMPLTVDSDVSAILKELQNAYAYKSVGDLLNDINTSIGKIGYYSSSNTLASMLFDIKTDSHAVKLTLDSIENATDDLAFDLSYMLGTGGTNRSFLSSVGYNLWYIANQLYLPTSSTFFGTTKSSLNTLVSDSSSSLTKLDTIIDNLVTIRKNQLSGGSSMAEVVEQLKTLNSQYVVNDNSFRLLFTEAWVPWNSSRSLSWFHVIAGAVKSSASFSNSINSILNGSSQSLSSGTLNPFHNSFSVWAPDGTSGKGNFFESVYLSCITLSKSFSSWIGQSWSVPSYDPEHPAASSVIGPSGLLFNLADNLSRMRYIFASEDEIKAKQDAADTEKSFFDTFLGAAAANKVKPSNIKEVSGVLGSITDTFSIPDVTPLQFPDALKNALTQDSGLMWFSQKTANDLDRVQLRSVMVMSSVDDASSQAYDAYFNPDIVTNYVEEDQKSVLSWFESWWSSNG